MNNLARFFSCNLCVAVLALAYSDAALATLLDVTVNTTSLTGQPGILYFDLISGGSGVVNTGTISNFNTNGSLGMSNPSGNATGSLPGVVTLATTSFFNEVAQNVTYGTQFSFQLNLTGNGPGAGNTPDAFSLFLGDNHGNTIPTTIDPTGGNALFLFNIDGSSRGNLNVYSSTDLPISWQVTSAVPEPEEWVLMLFGAGLVGFQVKLKKAGKPISGH